MDFEQMKNKIFEGIGSSFFGTLATHDEDSVSARTMSIIVVNDHFYFQTDKNSNKFRQININGMCAIAYEKYQIMGKCKILEHPFLEKNKTIYEAFKNAFPSAAKKYSGLEQETLIEVTPMVIKIWEYDTEGAHIDEIDFACKSYICRELGY